LGSEPTLLMAAQPQQEEQPWGRHEHGDLAMSYYILYADIAAAETAPAAADEVAASIAVVATTRTRTTEAETAKTEMQADSSLDESSSVAAVTADAVWVEDEWTEEDERQARHDLYSHDDEDDNEPDDWHYQPKERPPSCKTAMGEDDKNMVDDTVAWNRFYRRHRANFFKDRHYLLETFAHEFLHPSSSSSTTTRRQENIMVEFGCGVGNAVWPVLQAPSDVNWKVVGVDLSPTAIDLFRNDERFRRAQQEGTDRIQAFVMDITSSLSWPEGFRHAISNDGADIATLLFCLSAIAPDRHASAVRNVLASLRPGGVVLVRDYGRYDAAQFQLHRRRRNNNKDTSGVDHNNFYQKHDGTKVYYFTTDDLCRLFCHNADSDDDERNRCNVLECNYLRRVYQNRATGQTRRRVWVQARFRKREIDITTVE
jgi:SAM-dependent methyltransferase